MTNLQDGQQPLTSKYYIPEIEEFFYGYKYEVLERENEWLPQIFGEHYEPYDDVRDNKIRTKYLDKEDIESLGWKEVSSNKYRLIMKNPKDFDYEYYKEPVYLYLSFADYRRPYRLSIHNNEKYEEYNQWFEGECKSINELKTVMKWLHIDTEITK